MRGRTELPGRGRVRIATSYLLQGAAIDGDLLDEGSTGIAIRDDQGRELFLPWTSVGMVIRNPEVDDAQPF